MTTRPAQTKCARAGCEAQTPNTFCSRECNRLAHLGPGTRRTKLQVGCTGPGTHHATSGYGQERLGAVLEKEQVCTVLPAVSAATGPAPDSAGRRAVFNRIARRREREALTERRRASRKKRNA